MAVKTDRKDARGIAQLLRLGWFKPVHCKSAAAQEVRALLTARKLVQSKLYDVEMSLRGILRVWSEGWPDDAEALRRQGVRADTGSSCFAYDCKGADRHPRGAAARALRLREASSPAGEVRSAGQAVDDNARRGRDRRVDLCLGDRRSGPVFLVQTGWRPFRSHAKKYQSGETDITGRISKTGDAGVRAVLFEAAHIILTRPLNAGALKSWAMKLSRRTGMKKAKIALARKLAVILHQMWRDETAFDAAKASAV